MSRTAREADSRSVAPAGAAPTTTGFVSVLMIFLSNGLRQITQFFYGLNDDLFRHVIGDLDASQLCWQNEVHHAVKRLLVRCKALHYLLSTSLYFWERRICEDGRNDPSGCL